MWARGMWAISLLHLLFEMRDWLTRTLLGSQRRFRAGTLYATPDIYNFLSRRRTVNFSELHFKIKLACCRIFLPPRHNFNFSHHLRRHIYAGRLLPSFLLGRAALWDHFGTDGVSLFFIIRSSLHPIISDTLVTGLATPNIIIFWIFWILYFINLICHSSGSECSSPKADYSLPPRVPQVEYEYFLQNLNIFLQNLKSLESRMETFPDLSLCLSAETVAVKQTVRPPLFPPYHRLSSFAM